jgi:hypothetical protein
MSGLVRLSVNGSVAKIHCDYRSVFLCHSCDGVFPPTSVTYSDFCFEPERGQDGILVFDSQREPCDFSEYQYYWKRDKLIIEHGITKPKHYYNRSPELGYLVRIDGILITTHESAKVDEEYMVVDLVMMIKYIDGKLDAKQLKQHARPAQRAT